MAARSRYERLTDGLRAGPLRERMAELGGRVDHGVLATWEAAQRATQLERVLSDIGIEEATAAHKAAKRELEQAQRSGSVPAGLRERADALADRHASLHRLHNSLDDIATQLTVLEARLEAAVAQAAELALRPDVPEAPIAADLDAIVGELGAMRAALDGLGSVQR